MRVVVVFGGGGAQSLACLGAWQALTEAGLAPSHLGVTSLGAVSAAALINGRRLGDGGLRAVLALEVARSIPADLVVAVNVGPGFDEPPPPPSTALRRLLPPPLIRAHGEAIRIMMAAQTERAIAM